MLFHLIWCSITPHMKLDSSILINHFACLWICQFLWKWMYSLDWIWVICILTPITYDHIRTRSFYDDKEAWNFCWKQIANVSCDPVSDWYLSNFTKWSYNCCSVYVFGQYLISQFLPNFMSELEAVCTAHKNRMCFIVIGN